MFVKKFGQGSVLKNIWSSAQACNLYHMSTIGLLCLRIGTTTRNFLCVGYERLKVCSRVQLIFLKSFRENLSFHKLMLGRKRWKQIA